MARPFDPRPARFQSTIALAPETPGSAPAPVLRDLARAKVNLTLHVTGQRDDGYHLLQSLVVFPEIGDLLTATPDTSLRLTLDGPFARNLPRSDDNLIFRAARLLAPDRAAHLTLDKRLPVASGIGGGSADAAATLRLLARLWSLPLPPPETCLHLGADLPVCLQSTSCLMEGIGERLSAVPALPDLGILLVNPGPAIPTPEIFAALPSKTNPPMHPLPPNFSSQTDFIDWLAAQRNDLQPVAEARLPVITEILATLTASPACLLARMSGSGATCYALFPTEDDATQAHHRLAMNHPEWWSAAARL